MLGLVYSSVLIQHVANLFVLVVEPLDDHSRIDKAEVNSRVQLQGHVSNA